MTPTNGPDVLGPAPRDPAQKFWDPGLQTMDPSQRRELQDDRLRTMVRRIFDAPVPLFRRKLASAGISSPEAVGGPRHLESIPLTVKEDLPPSEPASPT